MGEAVIQFRHGKRDSNTSYSSIHDNQIPCEEVIDRIISCIAVTLGIKVIDINISKHVSAPNDACDSYCLSHESLDAVRVSVDNYYSISNVKAKKLFCR